MHRSYISYEECGKTLVEVLGVLAIVGVLSIMGFAAYKHALQKKLVNDLLYTTNITSVTISQDLQNKSFADTAEMNQFLSNYTQHVQNYTISFYVTDESFATRNFATSIAVSNGSPMSPSVCKNLILAMQKQHSIQAMDVTAEEKQKHIESGAIDLDAICGN